LKGDDDIQGIFTGRDNDFMIIPWISSSPFNTSSMV